MSNVGRCFGKRRSFKFLSERRRAVSDWEDDLKPEGKLSGDTSSQNQDYGPMGRGRHLFTVIPYRNAGLLCASMLKSYHRHVGKRTNHFLPRRMLYWRSSGRSIEQARVV